MKTLVVIACAFMAFGTPAMAFESEKIGILQAKFGSETIEQPTVLIKQGGKSSATAFLLVPGGGFSALSLAGYSLDNKRLGLELSYTTERPNPQSAPNDVTITYSPNGNKEHWTSEGAPSPAKVTFTTLDTQGKKGRAVASFKAVLCYAKDHDSDPDTRNCRSIEGKLDTQLFVEK